ncbi:hypothetical protein F4820DRAFT_441460, partial [Hypoxylon rubiginosum]
MIQAGYLSYPQPTTVLQEDTLLIRVTIVLKPRDTASSLIPSLLFSSLPKSHSHSQYPPITNMNISTSPNTNHPPTMPIPVRFHCGHVFLVFGKWYKPANQGRPNVYMSVKHFAERDVVALESLNVCGWECLNECPDDELDFALGPPTTTNTTTTTTTTGAAAATTNGKKRKYAEVEPLATRFGDFPSQNSGQEQQLHDLGVGVSTQAAGRMGLPDAVYGVPRIGVGWRPDPSPELVYALPPAPATMLAPMPVPVLVLEPVRAKKQKKNTPKHDASNADNADADANAGAYPAHRMQTDYRTGMSTAARARA